MIKYIKLVCLCLIIYFPNVFAQNVFVDDDPRRTVVFEQPRIAVILSILLISYNKVDAEELYKIYQTNPEAFDEIQVKYKDFTDTYRFTNPKGVDNPPTQVRYWKRHNNNNKSDASFFSLFGLSKTFAERQLGLLSEQVAKLPPPVAKPPPLTSLELRAMQTRRFNKSPWVLKNAIEEMFKDNNGICSSSGPMTFYPIGQKFKMENGVMLQLVEGYGPGKGIINCVMSSTAYEFEMTAKPPSKPADGQLLPYDPGMLTGMPTQFKIESSDIRLRIKAQGGRRHGIQDTNPEGYRTIFKKIADQVFVEALEIDPAVIE